MPLITETVFHNLATKRKTSAKNKLPPLNVRLNHRCTFFLKLFTLSCIPLSRELEIACYRSLERVSYPIRKSLNAYSRAEWLKRVHTFPWKNCLLTICTVKARLVRTKKKHTLQKQRAVFVVYCEDENRKHCEERLHVTWQIAYMGFKASSRKIPREPFFSSNRSKKQRQEGKTRRKMKEACLILYPCILPSLTSSS